MYIYIYLYTHHKHTLCHILCTVLINAMFILFSTHSIIYHKLHTCLFYSHVFLYTFPHIFIYLYSLFILFVYTSSYVILSIGIFTSHSNICVSYKNHECSFNTFKCHVTCTTQIMPLCTFSTYYQTHIHTFSHFTQATQPKATIKRNII